MILRVCATYTLYNICRFQYILETYWNWISILIVSNNMTLFEQCLYFLSDDISSKQTKYAYSVLTFFFYYITRPFHILSQSIHRYKIAWNKVFNEFDMVYCTHVFFLGFQESNLNFMACWLEVNVDQNF